MRPQCDNNYWLTSIGQIVWISLIPRHVFALCELLFLDAKVDFISQTTDKPRVHQTGCSICLCAIHVLLVVFWLGSCALMSNTQLYECLCSSSSRRTGLAEQLSDGRHVASERIFSSSSQPLLSSTITLFWWHFTRAGVRLVWWKGLPTLCCNVQSYDVMTRSKFKCFTSSLSEQSPTIKDGKIVVVCGMFLKLSNIKTIVVKYYKIVK